MSYSLENRQNYHGVPPLTKDRLKEGLTRAVARGNADTSNAQRKSKNKPGDVLRKAIAISFTEFPPALVDHALQRVHFDATIQLDTVLHDDAILDKIMTAMEEASKTIERLALMSQCKGYIFARFAGDTSSTASNKTITPEIDHDRRLIYEDFQPFRPRQFENPETTILEFNSFNQTTDEFFSSVESQKLESRLTEKEENAQRKLETAKLDHEKRIGSLQQVQQMNVRKAQAIEANLPMVEEAITTVNSLLAQGMDWQNVAQLIEVEKRRHNNVAEMIKLPLKLYENTITLLLAEESFEDEDDYEVNNTESDVSGSDSEPSGPSTSLKKKVAVDRRLAVDVDLAISTWSNARQYYDQKKSAAFKEQKTLQSSKKALKNTAKKINADLKKGLKQEKEVMRPQRKAYWFEKFIYFISSDGYLVLGSKDIQQAEILYKRYLKHGDIYVHADLEGAASIIIKNKPGKTNDPLPPSTLSQAGALALATSSAWDSKAIMSAWWVHAEQVSKTASNGEYLQGGNFDITMPKVFLAPAQLLLGFGLMFKISDASKARHLKHRVPENAHEPVKEKVTVVEKIKDRSMDGKVTTNEGASDNELLVRESDSRRYISHADGEASAGAHNEQLFSDRIYSPQDKHTLLGQRQNSVIDSQLDRGSEAYNDVNERRQRDPEAGSTAANFVGTADDNAASGAGHLSTGGGGLKSEDGTIISNVPRLVVDTDTKTRDFTQSVIPAARPSSRPSKPVSSTSLPTLHVRGKHAKRNKMKVKYAGQDEEDRALAMRLLGSATAQEKAKIDAATKESKEQEQEFQKARRREQHALAVEKGKKAEEDRRIDLEEGGGDSEEEHAERFVDLDSFVGAPLPGDEILDALVVCAPWDAIGGRCKWGVKLQPGATKKGKAVREILAKWTRLASQSEKGKPEGDETIVEEEKVRRREGELIKAIREAEVVGVVPVGKVRVVMGSGDKV